jgi:uncharacterized protein
MYGERPLEPAGPELEPPAAEPAHEPYPFWNYRDLALFIGLGLPSLMVGFALVTVFFWISPWQPAVPAVRMLPAQFLFYFFWFLCLWGLFRLKYNRPFWRSLAWRPPHRIGFQKAALLGLAAAVGTVVLGNLLRAPGVDQMPIEELLRDTISVVLLAVFATTLGPLCEELAFRGFFLPLLVRSFGPIAGIFIIAVPFALLHGPQYSWAWQQMVLITLVAAAFGWIRLVTGSTAAATVMHIAYNLFFSLILVLSKGAETLQR